MSSAVTRTVEPVERESAVGEDTAAFRDMRHAMVTSQLRTNAVSDQRVVAAMARIAREDFVPADARAIAYRDTALPAGNGRMINPPMATGRLLTEAYLLAADRVLLIGAAGGYAAAILSDIVAEVVAVEHDPALRALAQRATEGLAGVTLIDAPLTQGCAERGPYDVLVVDGAVEAVPPALVAQLKPGARIVTGLLERGVTRLASGRRTDAGFGVAPFVDSECVVLPGFSAPPAFRF